MQRPYADLFRSQERSQTWRRFATQLTSYEIAPVQYGFMPDKGTGNAIFVLRRLVGRSVEKQRDVYTCFIDYSKSFDTVKHESLVELLQSLDVDKSETRLTNLNWKQTAAVCCGDDISEWLDIKQGVSQECVASPHLFALYTEMTWIVLE